MEKYYKIDYDPIQEEEEEEVVESNGYYLTSPPPHDQFRQERGEYVAALHNSKWHRGRIVNVTGGGAIEGPAGPDSVPEATSSPNNHQGALLYKTMHLVKTN